jgi:hypothetical protein
MLRMMTTKPWEPDASGRGDAQLCPKSQARAISKAPSKPPAESEDKAEEMAKHP